MGWVRSYDGIGNWWNTTMILGGIILLDYNVVAIGGVGVAYDHPDRLLSAGSSIFNY